LDARLFEAPALGIEQSQQEVVRMGTMIADMLRVLKEIITAGVSTKEKQEYIFQQEREMDVIQKEVVEFVGQMMTGIIPRDVAAQARWQIRIVDEYETISDYITNILKLNLKLKDEHQQITDEGRQAILDLHENVSEIIAFINEAVRSSSGDVLTEATAKANYNKPYEKIPRRTYRTG
jgi:phosphate:Na+ symporter